MTGPTKEEELKKLFDHASKKREPHESEIQEAFELVKPVREWRPYKAASPPERETMVDATLARMARNLVTNTVRLLIPPNGQWARVTLANDKLQNDYGYQFVEHLTDADDKLMRFFTDSNFYLAMTEALYDEVIGGTMCLQWIDDLSKSLNLISVPTDELFFLDEFDQQVDVVFRHHKMTGRQIMRRWEDTAFSKEFMNKIKDAPLEELDIYESVVPFGSGYHYRISHKETFEKITDDEFLSLNPFVVARWEKMTGHVWGNSPCRDAMLHQRVSNAIRNDILRYGAFVAGGLWQTTDETVNTENLQGQLEPGAIISLEEQLQPLEFPGQFGLTYEMIKYEKEEMKHLMFDSTPPSEDALKYMNDVAVSFLRQEFLSQVGEPAQRLQRELLSPLAIQAAKRLQRRGAIYKYKDDEIAKMKIPLHGIASGGDSQQYIVNQDQLFKVDVSAAIQKAQAAQEAQEISAAIANVGSIVGPQQIAMHVDMDKATRKMLMGGGIPPDIMRSEKQVKQIQQELAQQAIGEQATAAAGSIAQGQEGFEPVRPIEPSGLGQ